MGESARRSAVSPLHKPVLLKEVLDTLDPKRGEVFVDCTLGDGGHARQILKRLGPRGHLIGIDCDREALERAGARLKRYRCSVTLIWSNFSSLEEALRRVEVKRVNGILMDLGLSSRQLDDPRRGFSFARSGPLDMRMDPEANMRTARELLETLSESELVRILSSFGEERYSRRIARVLSSAARRGELITTLDLARRIRGAVPRRRWRINPATRSFQAIRIAVNDELARLDLGLDAAWRSLAAGGRLGVISFHSLEDRIAKRKIRGWVESGEGKALLKKGCCPGRTEVRSNPRSRSARLRAVLKK